MDGMTQGWPVSGFLRDLIKVSCKEPSKIVFGGGAVQCCAVEFLIWGCLGTTGLNVHEEFGPDHEVIGPALCSAHSSGGKNIPSVLLPDNYIVQEVPVL